MTAREVHWHEGMFLRPHHFQAAQRHWQETAARSGKWDSHHNWGVRSVEIDLDALSNHRFVVRELKARLRDGTLVSIPEDGVLPTLDLKEAFGRESHLTIYLGVPVLRMGRANIATDAASAAEAKFLTESIEIEDENSGVNLQRIKVRMLNLKLLLSTQDHTGFEVLPLARIEKAVRAESVPQLDDTFFPPLLACDAWKPLTAGILQPIFDRIGKKIELLSSQAVTRGITLDSQAQGDRLIFAQLRELNEAYCLLGVIGFVPGLHPLNAYLELVRLVGQLSIFGATRRPPDLPRYDHDDLATCFYRVKQHIDDLLNIFVEPEYKERPFVGAGLRMQVALEPAWLESVWQMYVGVQSRLEPEECIRLLTRPGQLDMKIGSSDRVDAIFRMGQAGLKFDYCQRPPRALPAQPGLIYFEINRSAQQEEWQNVQKSLALAIRLNETMIAGNIQGERVLTIKAAGHTTTLQFTLFVVPTKG